MFIEAFILGRIGTARTDWLWLVCPYLVMCLRQFCLLPMVIATVPMFTLGLGMDALNVALNAMAVLFILEVDNAMYGVALTDRQREYLGTVEVSR